MIGFRNLRPIVTAFGAAILMTTFVTTGCEQPPGTGGPDSITAPESVQQARRLFHSSFDDLYREKLREEVETTPIENALRPEASWPALKWRSWLQEIYYARDWQPMLSNQGVPGPAALAFLEHAKDANAHGLQASKYVRPAIGRHIQHAGEANAACSNLPTPRLVGSSLQVADEALDAAEDEHPSNVAAFVWDKLMNDDRSAALRQAYEQQVRLKRMCAGINAGVELVLADALIEYVHDVRGFNWVRINPEADEEEAQKIVKRETTSLFTDIATAASRDEASTALDALFPDLPPYERLLAARERYQGYVDEGGFGEPIEPRALRRGAEGETVRQLKERLKAEEFYTGEVNSEFDAALEEAVEAYQETHQMDVTGRTSSGFWSSINTSAEDRLAQIELTLQRWRESRTLDDDYYVHVNIPDFHAELWKDGELVRRFRIVVGNTKKECRDEQMEYVNATPIQSAEMTYVVLNPYWNVPDRIVREELLPKLAEEPKFFEEEGYEMKILDNGYKMVRQLPGEENALGQVKFMFPNEHNTYMHDTPNRSYFRYPVRAFSHGCMRVHEPMGLLQTILELDGQWDPRRIEQIQERGRERRLSLNEPINVHSEYFVVRADEEGRVHFNADIYRLDRERLDPYYVRLEECQPENETKDEYVLTDEGTVMVRDEQGNLMDPNDAKAEDEESVDPDAQIALPMDFGP